MKKLVTLPILLLLAFTLIAYLPVFLNPSLLLGRNNDLTEFFWPLLYYSKQSILIHHQIPLWNTLWLSGTPLASNPQAPIFYLPHILYLILPIDFGIFLFSFTHILLGGIGVYYLSQKVIKSSTSISWILAALYIVNPKMAGFIEAGHYGLILSFGTLPWVYLAFLSYISSKSKKWLLIFLFVASSIFFNHTVTFIWLLLSLGLIYSFIFLQEKGFRARLHITKEAAILICLVFGIISISLIPQLNFLPLSTRNLLLEARDVYPKWNSKVEFLRIVFLPMSFLFSGINNIDTEKWIPIGSVAAILSFIGFLRLKFRHKVWVSALIIITFLFMLNNASPLFPGLIKSDFYVLNRVSTRIWFIDIFIFLLLIGLGLKFLTKYPKLLILCIGLMLIESTSLSWMRLTIPIGMSNYVSKSILSDIKKDPGIFRVFCLTRCISQKDAAINNLELTDGYDTVAQKNFYQHAWQLTNSYWNYYTLAIPPDGITRFKQIQPNAQYLGDYNIKYVIAPYLLEGQGLKLIKKDGQFFIYLNELNLPRAYFVDKQNNFIKEAKISFYSPNKIDIDADSSNGIDRLIVSNVYNPGWKAELSDSVQQTPGGILSISTIQPKDIHLTFDPAGFKMGLVISIISLIILIGVILK